MVTIGRGNWTRGYSVPRAKAYAARHGYDFIQVTEPSPENAARTPHWEKLLIPLQRPEYDRWLVLDDDVLVNTRSAPPLPEVPAACLGLVKEPVPTRFPEPMEWLGNTGVLVFDAAATDLLRKAYDLGEYKEIVPGYGDQPAVNRVAWQEGRVSRLDRRWNYMPMADWLLTAHGQDYPWTPKVTTARLARATLAWALTKARVRRALGGPLPSGPLARLHESFCIHLIWFRFGTRWVSRFLEA